MNIWRWFLVIAVISVVIFLVIWAFSGEGSDSVVKDSDSAASSKVKNVGNEEGEKNESISSTNKSLVNDSLEFKEKRIVLTDSLKSERILLSKSSDGILEDENIRDVFRVYLTQDHIPFFLRNGSFYDLNKELVWYDSTIGISDKFTFEFFADEDYDEDENYTAFRITEGGEIFNYSVVFREPVSFSNLVGSNLRILGKNYYVYEATSLPRYMKLLESSFSFLFFRDEEVVFSYPGFDTQKVRIAEMNNDFFRLNVSDNISREMRVGNVYFLNDLYYYVLDSDYCFQPYGNSYVELVVSPNELVLYDGTFEDEGEIYRNPEVKLYPARGDLERIDFSWQTKGTTHFTYKDNLLLPYFETINLTTTKARYNKYNDKYTNVTMKLDSYEIREVSSN